ncbi:MAG: organic solvent tolerance protein OstA [Pirellulaceae bacterium]|nr:organic solvent tolerance protein OstA [Pirellulaceae bacterium]
MLRHSRFSLLLIGSWLTATASAQLPIELPQLNLPSVLRGDPKSEAIPQGNPSPVAGPAQQRIRVFPRSSVRWQARWFPSDDGLERIGVIDSGVNIIIDNVQQLDTVDISTDRLVIWTPANSLPDLQGGDTQTENVPLELYLEGNIVFRQGDRVIYADRMYYNVQEERGVVLNSELLTPIPGYKGLIRLKAEVLQQVDKYNFQGFNGALTTSRLGVPGYWLQSGRFTFQDAPGPIGPSVVNSSLFDEVEPVGEKRISSRNNLVYLGGQPIFYWPFLAGDLDRPSFYLEALAIRNDQVFGTQVETDINLFQLFGIRRAPAGTTWTGSLDYLSKRGFGLGTNVQYDRNRFLRHDGHTYGFFDAWGIHDRGFDNLGKGRRMVPLETENRGRVLARHRHELHHNLQFTLELGYISDRNFLEQYYEEEWDDEKDQSTRIGLRKRVENHSWAIWSEARLNDFFTQTEWLPRFDQYLIGQPVLGNNFTWTSHTNVGYPKLQTAVPPQNLADQMKFDPLAWEFEREGLRAASRNELSMPLAVGPMKIVPYVLGEAAYWKEDLAGNEANRLFGQIGIRSSVPFWRVNPNIRSTLFNLNGLAHKIILEGDFFWADANLNLDKLPLYDELDDDSIEFFRRRFFFDTFGGVAGGDVPFEFDERSYALRSGLQRSVTSPSTEVADDLMIFEVNARQRWQTKRGLPGSQRVIDYITLNVGGFFYPKADRDNFGASVGLVNYDFIWNLGDRVSVVSDGQFDFFSDGLQTASIKGVVSRPGKVNYVGGVRGVRGPFESTVIFGSTNYRLSQKWIVNYGSSFDLGNTGNIGQRGQIVRVGESFLVGMGFNYDRSRDNFGVGFTIEPRFLPGQLSRIGGIQIPPVGVEGLE